MIGNIIRKIITGFVAGVAWVAEKLQALFTNAVNAASDCKSWMAAHVEAVPLKELSKLALIRAFVLFVFGFLCCIAFPEEAKGDLTWFERMYTSAMNWSSFAIQAAKERTVGWIHSKFNRKVAVT